MESGAAFDEAALRAAGWVNWSARQRLIKDQVEIDLRSGCWLWTGDLRNGYGIIGRQAAYRLSYEAFVGPIPFSYHINHVCRVRRCVNPEQDGPRLHLEAVTHAENNRRAMRFSQRIGRSARVRTSAALVMAPIR